jgi:hypothetical protein
VLARRSSHQRPLQLPHGPRCGAFVMGRVGIEPTTLGLRGSHLQDRWCRCGQLRASVSS